jgi:hypothetical protein
MELKLVIKREYTRSPQKQTRGCSAPRTIAIATTITFELLL